MSLTPGEKLGPYEILAPIGAGGMGQVFQARDSRLNRLVAVKIAQGPFTERFEREARAVAALNHPHICTLYDVGPNYLVMEYIDGKPLAGPLPMETVVRYAGQIASALDAAHRAGIVHRDLKPANILVTKAGVKLLDFGLAKLGAGAAAGPLGETAVTATVTQDGAIIGTLHYMSPEQLEGKIVDARSDIFAFGCVLYEMITGRMAFPGDSQASVIAAILERQPAPLIGAPPLVAKAIERCLAKEPDDRWQSAPDVASVLQLASSAAPVPAPTAGNRRLLLGLIAAACFIALAAAIATSWSIKPPQIAQWSGSQLGGPAVALTPRISPDGSLVAFLAMVDGQSQLAVLKPQTGNWTVLTHQHNLGEIKEIAWASDGATLYFDRFSGVPAGVYSVPVLGGEPRLVVDAAADPQVLADGGLTVIRVNSKRNLQLYRFRPDSGKIEPLPVIPLSPRLAAVRATPDGKHLLVFGNRADAAGDRLERGFFSMDPDGGNLKQLAPRVMLPGSPQQGALAFAGYPDGRHVLLSVPSGALYRFLKIPIDGGDAVEPLFTASLEAGAIDVARDGSIFADQLWEERTLLRFSASGGAPERLTVPYSQKVSLMAVLPDGRPLMQMFSNNRSHVVIVQADGSLSPLLESGEACGPPASLAGAGHVALMTDTPREVAVVGVKEGRILTRVKLQHGPATSLAASPDGSILYYSAAGFIWSAPVSGGEESRLAPGDSVAADPNGKELVIAAAQQDSITLSRLPVSGGPAKPVPIQPGMQIPAPVLASGAVAGDGRIATAISTASQWFYSLGVIDPRKVAVTILPAAADEVASSPMWTPDGKIVAEGREFNFTIWQFRSSAK